MDAHKGGGPAIARWLDRDELIEANAGVAVGKRTCTGCADTERLLARVNNDEVVAQAVHLYEFAGRHARDIGLQGTTRPAKRLAHFTTAVTVSWLICA